MGLLVCGVVAGAAGHAAVAAPLLLAAPTLWVRGGDGATPMARPVVWLSWSVVGTTAALMLAGAAATVSGPGATGAWALLTEIHADLVMAVFGLVLAMVFLLAAVDASRRARRLTGELLTALLAQGVLGYAAYFASAPRPLALAHLAGSVLVWAASLRLHRELCPRHAG